jgi:hypothetical protein
MPARSGNTVTCGRHPATCSYTVRREPLLAGHGTVVMSQKYEMKVVDVFFMTGN